MTQNILIVDDDVRLQGLLSRYLAEQGFRPETASNGEAMQRLVQRRVYDLYLLGKVCISRQIDELNG